MRGKACQREGREGKKRRESQEEGTNDECQGKRRVEIGGRDRSKAPFRGRGERERRRLQSKEKKERTEVRQGRRRDRDAKEDAKETNLARSL